MDAKSRVSATKTIWSTLGFVLFALLVTSAFGDGFGAGQTIFGVALIILGFLSTGMVWNWGDIPNSNSSIEMGNLEKAKREHIDNIISKLSDDDLMVLKRRLADGSLDEESFYEHMALTDDGELVPLERQ